MAERRIDWESHRRDADDENLQFLLASGQSMSAATARLGVKKSTIEQRQARGKTT